MARILIVDDDPNICLFAEAVLGEQGHHVFTAKDAMEGMAKLDAIPIDLLLSDANMPHYSGYDLIKTVRKSPKFRHTAIAMMTSRKERKDVERALHAGVDDYIVKPIDPLLLLQKVDAIFEKRPPTEQPEVRFQQKNKGNEVSLTQKSHLLALSEVGVEISVHFPVELGAIVDLDGSLFQAIDASLPPLKVIQKREGNEVGEWVLQLGFVGASEATLQKIRKWVYSHGSLLKKTGS